MGAKSRYVAATVAVLGLGFLGAAAAGTMSPAAKPPSPPGSTPIETGTASTGTTSTESTGTTATTVTTKSPTAGTTTITPTLYAATGEGQSASSLYTVDTGTGAATKVADITHSSTQVIGVAGLAFDPTSGTLYGFTNGGFFGQPGHGHGTLFTIDPSTGVATLAGTSTENGVAVQASDIAFDLYGNLYAWESGCGSGTCNDNGSDLFAINKTTGVATQVSESGSVGFRAGLAVDSHNRMYLKTYEAIYQVNQYTGHVSNVVSCPDCDTGADTGGLLAFDSSDTAYTATRFESPEHLEQLDLSNGTVSAIGSLGIGSVSALAWNAPATPSKTDLSLTKSVDNATPTAGTNVVFTIIVHNGGPDSTSNVTVKDKLPSGFSYVSDDASGDYDSTSGSWTISSPIANGGNATLHITAEALASGNHTNDAEVVDATTIDPDSAYGAGEGDAFAAMRSAPAGSPALYAVTGGPPDNDFNCGGGNDSGGAPSALYELDPTNASATKVANITMSGNPITHVTALAIDPTSGQLYGFRDYQGSNCDTSAIQGDGTLIAIDKTTGVATAVGGSNGTAAIQVSDMAFTPDGTLYAWNEYNSTSTADDLFTLDTSTGASTKVAECGCPSDNTGLAADSVGRMYVKNGGSLQRLDQFTGLPFGSTVFLTSFANDILAFGPSDSLYTGVRSQSTNGFDFALEEVDPSTGTFTSRGTNEQLYRTSALAWDLGTTSVNIADLSLDKTSDITSPAKWFTQITFTITVTNDGPDDATGVQVYDPVPSGFTFVSKSPSQGSYDENTGIWDVGTVSATGGSNSETLELVLAVQPSGSYQNTAEVVDSTSYDPDSVPSSVQGDTVHSKTITPTANPAVNIAADVIVSGQATRASASSKGFTVKLTNVGTVDTLVDQSMLDVDVLKNNVSTGQATCKAFSSTLKPGRSVRAHCSFNIAGANLSPGDSVKYTATINASGDGFASNDTDFQAQPVT